MTPLQVPASPFPAALDPTTLLRSDSPVHLPLPPGEPFDPEHTFRCGQVFRWRQSGDTWYGPYGVGALAVRLVREGLEVRALGGGVTLEAAWRFLGLHVSLQEVEQRLHGDPWVAAAMTRLRGLRVLRQDPWDCLAAYVCSSWNNIPKIELSTERVARAWGTVHRWPEGVETASLPPPEVLAALQPADLQGSALGYRCGYLTGAARAIVREGIDLAKIRSLAYDDALRALMPLPGIGRKVADCILLFSLDQPQACPVDLWVRRVVHELYPRELARHLPDAAERAEKGLSTREYDAITRFAREQWGSLAGYAQQYLFHARRTGGPGVGRRPDAHPGEESFNA